MLDELPFHILVNIAARLHWRDLIALEQVNQKLRMTMIGNVLNDNNFFVEKKQITIWNQIGANLIYHSLDHPFNLLSIKICPQKYQIGANLIYHAFDHPFNVLNLKRCLQKVKKNFLNNRQLKAIFERCNKNRIRVLDLATERTIWSFTGRSRFPSRINGTICHSLEGFTQLNTLDLSGIPIPAYLLLIIGRFCGQNLRILRLNCCFKPEIDNWHEKKRTRRIRQVRPQDLPKNAEFGEFLSLVPNLEELELGGCFLNENNVLSFANLSNKIHKLILPDIRPQQLLEIANICGTRLRYLHTVLRVEFSQQQFNNIFNMFSNLETLWLSNDDDRQDIELNFTKQLSSQIRHLTLGCFTGDESLATSFLAHPHPFVRLERLVLRCELYSACPHESPSGVDCECIPKREMLLQKAGHNNYMRLCRLAPNITVLDLFRTRINDNELTKLALIGHLEEVKIYCCPNATWRGLAACLMHCPNLRLLGEYEQMTEELLQLTIETMDRRNGPYNEPIEKADHLKKCFRFLRNYACISPEPFENKECVQSENENMHPWIVWREELTNCPIDARGFLFNKCM